jgi:hypothetical protein
MGTSMRQAMTCLLLGKFAQTGRQDSMLHRGDRPVTSEHPMPSSDRFFATRTSASAGQTTSVRLKFLARRMARPSTPAIHFLSRLLIS